MLIVLLNESHTSVTSLLLLACLLRNFFIVLLLLGVLRADTLEDGEAGLRWHSNVELADVGVGNLVDSGFHNRGIFVQ